MVVPGLWAPDLVSDATTEGQHRLIEQFRGLGRHADVVVVDAGDSSGTMVQRFCEVADQAIVITTPEGVAIMDAYAAIKTLLAPMPKLSISLLVNRAP